MDMKCLKCREPWDWGDYIRGDVLRPDGEDDSLYERMKTDGGYVKDHPNTDQPSTLTAAYDSKATWQFTPGPVIAQCPNCIGKGVKLSEAEELASEIQSALADILGDDVDGLMAEMEDLGF